MGNYIRRKRRSAAYSDFRLVNSTLTRRIMARDRRTPPTDDRFVDMYSSIRVSQLGFVGVGVGDDERIDAYDWIYLERKEDKIITRAVSMHLWREIIRV